MEITEFDIAQIAKFAIFNGIPKPELLQLLSGCQTRHHNHREVLYEIGDEVSTFAIVLDGAYKLIKPTINGDDFIVYFATEGDAIAALLMGQSSKTTYPLTVKAIGRSRVCMIPRFIFQKSWKPNPQILLRLNSLLYERIEYLQDEKILSRAPLTQRLAWFLLKMLERNLQTEDFTIPLLLTRQEIADHLGVAVESVIRIMSQWSQSGFIRTTDRQIEILKVDQIIELAKK